MPALIRWAHERRKLGLPALSVAWGPWSGGGMASADDLDAMKRFGQHPVQPDRALATLDQLLAVSATQATVVAIDWGTFLPLYQARPEPPLGGKARQDPARDRSAGTIVLEVRPSTTVAGATASDPPGWPT